MYGLDGRVVRIRISCSGASCFLVTYLPLSWAVLSEAYYAGAHTPTSFSMYQYSRSCRHLRSPSPSVSYVGRKSFLGPSFLAVCSRSSSSLTHTQMQYCLQKSSLLAMHTMYIDWAHITTNVRVMTLAGARTHLVTQAASSEPVYAGDHWCTPRPPRQSSIDVDIALRNGYMQAVELLAVAGVRRVSSLIDVASMMRGTSSVSPCYM